MVPHRSGQRPRVRRATQAAAGFGLLLLCLAGCNGSTWSVDKWPRWGWPAGVTPQAKQMLHLWQGSTVAALVVGIFVWGLIFWCVVRYRKRSDELPPQVRYNLPIEVLYTVLPFLVISVLFFYTAVDENYVNKTTAHPDVEVSVVAFKWNWRFAYLNEKDNHNHTIATLGTSNQIPVLVLPTHRSIRFIEQSDDVIHSFWVPEFLFKRDVIPGRINTFQISSIDRTGAFVGRCAELCGTYHSMMNFEVRAVSPGDYQKFLAARRRGLSTPQALSSIGQPPYAVSTHPFNTSRTNRSPSSSEVNR